MPTLIDLLPVCLQLGTDPAMKTSDQVVNGDEMLRRIRMVLCDQLSVCLGGYIELRLVIFIVAA